MKKIHAFLPLAAFLLTQTVTAQDAITSGEIRYEATRRIDLSQVRVNINGQEVRPGGTLPNGQTFDVPQTTTYGQSLLFSGDMAMEKRDAPAMMMRTMRVGGPDGPGGAAGGDRGPDNRPMRNGRFTPPFDNSTYIDMSSQTMITVLSVKKDSVTTEHYRNDEPITRDSTWREDDKTKKLLGYKCKRATANIRNTPYTIWYTTEIPLTYSPVARLTPDKGVVLQIESDQEAFKATKIEARAIDAVTLRPNAKAQLVSKKQMEEIRRKSMASFRQRMMAENPMRN
ncbi:GLPGLI family protein [Rudanella lutea]|uniref:GLPGLI family protein n=1 Tax=Rudanella lutea TaxID=451374 RepID=UPI00035F7CCE|nr:GLPGLI family protein [Rudanella lutea]